MKLLPGYKRNEVNFYVMIWKDIKVYQVRKDLGIVY